MFWGAHDCCEIPSLPKPGTPPGAKGIFQVDHARFGSWPEVPFWEGPPPFGPNHAPLINWPILASRTASPHVEGRRLTSPVTFSYVAVLRMPYFYIANCNTLGIKNYIPRLFNNIPQKTANPAIHN